MTRTALAIGGGIALLALLVGVWIGARFAAQAPPRATPAATNAVPYRAGPFQFALDVEPRTPIVGQNRLRLVLRDAQGKPVQGAEIGAVAEMPAMGTMAAMRAPASMQESSPGVYEGTFEPAMKGAWPLTVTIHKEELGDATVGFDMATGREGLTPTLGLSGGAPGSGEAKQAAEEKLPPGTIMVDARRRQLIGVTTQPAQMRPLTRTIRAVGRIVSDERRLADVSLKYEAWIGELKADFVGAPVRRGDVLFTVYSPALYAAQEEYLETYRRKLAPDLLAAARQRLAFWDVDDAFISALEKRGTPLKFVPIRAPQSGTVIMKNVVAGTAQKPGTTLLRIADLSRVWVEAEVYEADLPLISTGMPAAITLPYLPGKSFEARVDYFYPYLQGESRTGKIRLSLPNDTGVLRPDMFADVKLEVRLPAQLSVPDSAVIIAGNTRVVFEDLGDGRLAPRIVSTGQEADGWIQILSGLKTGARIVTSGNFLIASESRLQAGIKQW